MLLISWRWIYHDVIFLGNGWQLIRIQGNVLESRTHLSQLLLDDIVKPDYCRWYIGTVPNFGRNKLRTKWLQTVALIMILLPELPCLVCLFLRRPQILDHSRITRRQGKFWWRGSGSGNLSFLDALASLESVMRVSQDKFFVRYQIYGFQILNLSTNKLTDLQICRLTDLQTYNSIDLHVYRLTD